MKTIQRQGDALTTALLKAIPELPRTERKVVGRYALARWSPSDSDTPGQLDFSGDLMKLQATLNK